MTCFPLAALAVLCAVSSASAQPIPVTVDNFIRAESDTYIGNFVKESGGLGKLQHRREPASIDNQTVIRLNRDTLYSLGGVRSRRRAGDDHDAGCRQALHVADGRSARTTMRRRVYGKGRTRSTRRQGRHPLCAARRSARWSIPNDPKDVEQVHALQDAIKVEPEGHGTFEVPSWDPASQKKVRDALAGARFNHRPDFEQRVRHEGAGRSGPASDRHRGRLGRQSRQGCEYLNVTPAKNDGNTVYKLNVKDVPVDGFWSVSVYNAQGLLREERVQRLFGQQHHGEEERGRRGRHPVRRLRRQDPELPADHEGLELHGAALSSDAPRS